jgi:hypothetical protein
MRVTTIVTRASKRRSTVQSACSGCLWQASGDLVTTCLPSRLSRVRAPSPAPSNEPSLYWLTTGRFVASKRRESQQAGGFMLCQKAYSDILPRFGVTPCPARRDTLPHFAHCLTKIFLCPLQALLSLRFCPGLSSKTASSLINSGVGEEHGLRYRERRRCFLRQAGMGSLSPLHTDRLLHVSRGGKRGKVVELPSQAGSAPTGRTSVW